MRHDMQSLYLRDEEPANAVLRGHEVLVDVSPSLFYSVVGAIPTMCGMELSWKQLRSQVLASHTIGFVLSLAALAWSAYRQGEKEYYSARCIQTREAHLSRLG